MAAFINVLALAFSSLPAVYAMPPAISCVFFAIPPFLCEFATIERMAMLHHLLLLCMPGIPSNVAPIFLLVCMKHFAGWLTQTFRCLSCPRFGIPQFNAGSLHFVVSAACWQFSNASVVLSAIGLVVCDQCCLWQAIVWALTHSQFSPGCHAAFQNCQSFFFCPLL